MLTRVLSHIFQDGLISCAPSPITAVIDKIPQQIVRALNETAPKLIEAKQFQHELAPYLQTNPILSQKVTIL